MIMFLHIVPSGPPSNFTITVNKTSLICTWDPPEESAQNGEIVSYTLTCYSGGETVINLTLNPTVLEIDLNLFNYSTTYTCSLAASTLVGTGPTTVSSVTTEGIYSHLQMKAALQ